MDRDHADAQDARRVLMLEELLALDAIGLDAAMAQAAQRLADVLGADKVDVFLYDETCKALVAIGTSQTPMGRHEHELGLDRLPVADGGWAVDVFRTGRSHLAIDAEREPGELTRLVDELGVRSAITVPLAVAGERHGVLVASSATPGFFADRDLRFVETVARWIGLVADRAAHVQCFVREAAERAAGLAAEATVKALTARQQEVAGLITEGLTNDQIARRLVLTPGTVANHMGHILRRLGLSSRVQVATWATRYGLGTRAGPGEDTGTTPVT